MMEIWVANIVLEKQGTVFMASLYEDQDSL